MSSIKVIVFNQFYIKKIFSHLQHVLQLLHLGKDYPSGYEFFRTRLHKAFLKNKDVTDPETIQKMIAHGEYIVKELEALYMLKKYRTLKRRYYNEK